MLIRKYDLTLIIEHKPVGTREKWANIAGTKQEVKLLKVKENVIHHGIFSVTINFVVFPPGWFRLFLVRISHCFLYLVSESHFKANR